MFSYFNLNNFDMGRPKESIEKKLSKIRISMNMDKAKALYTLGMTDQQVADFFGVSKRSVEDWKKDHNFSSPLKEWKDSADGEIEASLHMRAKGFTDPSGRYYPPDPTSMIFWLKNRQPAKWREKVDVEHSGDLILNYGYRKKEPA